MTTRARLEDPNVSISDILTPEEEAAYRLGVEYKILTRGGRKRSRKSDGTRDYFRDYLSWRIGLTRKLNGRYVTLRTVGSVATRLAYARICTVLPMLHLKGGKWPPRERPPKPPESLEVRAERRRVAKRVKAEQALARWQRKLKTAETKVKKYRRQLKPGACRVSFGEAYYAARRAAEAAVPRVVLIEDGDAGEDWRDRKNPTRRFKRCKVELHLSGRTGFVIGTIEQGRRHSYRKAGRIIMQSWYPLCWFRSGEHRLSSDTRKAAILELLIDHFTAHPEDA